MPDGGFAASARMRCSRASAARHASSRPGRTRSSTSRSRSENCCSLRPSPATMTSPRPVRMPIAIPYTKPDGRSRSPCTSLRDRRRGSTASERRSAARRTAACALRSGCPAASFPMAANAPGGSASAGIASCRTAPVASSTRSHVSTSTGTSSASPAGARRRKSVATETSVIARTNGARRSRRSR